MLEGTSTKHAPWHIIPADHKWVRNYHIARIVEKALEKMDLTWPPASDPKLLKMRFD